MKVAICKFCGTPYEGRRRQRHCSISCGRKALGAEWYRQQARKRSAKGYSDRIRRFKAAGLTDAQIALVFREIHSVEASTHKSGVRLGRRQGFAEALGEGDDLRRTA
jgi:hypothetical protein